MNHPAIPILIVPCLSGDPRGPVPLLAKLLGASLLRSLFGGTVVVFRDGETPLLKVERKQLEEVQVHTAGCKTEAGRRRAKREFLFGLEDYLKPEPRQWVMVADPASLALRSLDHLLPPDLPGPYAPPEIDFLWSKAGAAGGRRGCGYSGVRFRKCGWHPGPGHKEPRHSCRGADVGRMNGALRHQIRYFIHRHHGRVWWLLTHRPA